MPLQNPPLTIDLSDLETAVRSGDRPLAVQIAQSILQRLATDAAVHAEVERQVRALLITLDENRPTNLLTLDNTQSEAGSLESIDAPTEISENNAAQDEGIVYPVWFGTNRKPAGGGKFTNERHPQITFGRVLVHIPKTHRFGEIGSNFWKRLFRFELRNDRLRIQQVEERESVTFFSEVRDEMKAAEESGDRPHALIFLHGFNVNFEDAAIRAAQIGIDLKVPGATAFFSWPSRGTVVAYPIDEATIEASERAITEFLIDFTMNCGAEKVHVIAHSMGNRGFLRALQRIAAKAETRGKVKFGQIFLAAPDVDRDVFLDLANLYSEFSERTTLYASDADKPIHLSAKLHDAPRAGYFTPYTVAPNIDTIAVPDFDIDLLGHGYFSQADALLYDISDLMRHGEPPIQRQRVMAAVYEGVRFWELAR